MDKISKALKKLSEKEREKVKEILLKLKVGVMDGLDIKKLKGHDCIYRVRKGTIRIICNIENGGEIYILAIEKRSDNTYNF
ncbi:MAG: hypothetical protein V1860_04290 [bacterium]